LIIIIKLYNSPEIPIIPLDRSLIKGFRLGVVTFWPSSNFLGVLVASTSSGELSLDSDSGVELDMVSRQWIHISFISENDTKILETYGKLSLMSRNLLLFSKTTMRLWN
jgi:hypothetical protein